MLFLFKFLIGAVGTIAAGIGTFVRGVKTGSWSDIVTGGLSIMATIASFMGAAGTGVSNVLMMLSAIFGVFGGSFGKF